MVKERQELEVDRQKRRRSFVKLDFLDDLYNQSPIDVAVAADSTATSLTRRKGGSRSAFRRSLRSVGSHASSLAYSEHPSVWQKALQRRPSGAEASQENSLLPTPENSVPILVIICSFHGISGILWGINVQAVLLFSWNFWLFKAEAAPSDQQAVP